MLQGQDFIENCSGFSFLFPLAWLHSIYQSTIHPFTCSFNKIFRLFMGYVLSQV